MKFHKTGMKQLRGLRAQVLLWMILPLMVLLIVFSLSGIQSHRNAMHSLAVEESSRMVRALAQVIAVTLENVAFRSQVPVDEVSITSAELENTLSDIHLSPLITLALVNPGGDALFALGPMSTIDDVLLWPDMQRALDGASGASLVSSAADSDLIAYAPITGTDWVLVIREPWQTLNIPLIRLEQTMPFIVFISILISVLALVFGVRLIVQPLRKLEHRAFQIGQGNYDAASKPVGGVNEIEDLRLAIHEMAGQLQQTRDTLQAYLGAITETQESERARIARELHDDTVQDLVTLDHRAQRIQRTLRHDPDLATEHVTELRRMIDKTAHDVRRICWVLRPLYLDELGLVAALESLASEAGAIFQVIGTSYRLQGELESNLYRIAQEALNNALQHAQAEKIKVEIRYGQEDVTLEVCDDGVGFEFDAAFNDLAQRRHFGLIGMRERAQLAGGQLQILSLPDSGTTVTVAVSKY